MKPPSQPPNQDDENQPQAEPRSAALQWLMGSLDRFLPSDPLAAMDEVFSRLKQELPSPCIVLVGEPQVGKSSSVRVLTGDPAAEIGLGDGVPVTMDIEAFHFPKDSELPLWTFLDTPGVGTKDLSAEKEDFVRLYQGEATFGETDQPVPAPHMMLACVRVDDEELNILPWLQQWKTLSEVHETLPLLVVQTCLHRIMHPHPMPYPFGEKGDLIPDDLPHDVAKRIVEQRTQIIAEHPQAQFVLVDLTDPEDLVGDPTYGADALVNAVFSMLPDAIVQMLRLQREAFDTAFDAEANRLVWSYSVVAAATGAIPPPVGDIGTLAVTLTMLRQLSAQYRQPLELRTVLDLLWSLGSTTLLWLAARYLMRRIPIPILMAPVGAAGAFSLVFSIGQLMSWYYSDVLEGHQPTTEDVKRHWEQAQADSQAHWKQVLQSMWKKEEE